MKFDVAAAVAEVLSGTQTPATVATVATEWPKSQPERENSSKVAEVARGVLSEKTTDAHDHADSKPARPTLVYTSDDDALAFAAIETDCRTYGAVATTTRMGATRAFQATERLKDAGRIQQAKDGTLSASRSQS